MSLAEDVHRGEFVTAAAEWLLDNYHLVASEIRDVRQNLPRAYYRELPKLAPRELKGDARVYAMAVALVRHSDSRLDWQQLVRMMLAKLGCIAEPHSEREGPLSSRSRITTCRRRITHPRSWSRGVGGERRAWRARRPSSSA